MPVASHSNLVVAIVDMCMAGLRDPENGLRLQKRSEIWASDERLVAHLGNLYVMVSTNTA